ncbi:MAG TPA: hypothetical protein VFE50_00010 [Cyclobacteriaceae bacterium]|nr:hypothetical protein [Cyclobacteriaceae bacterium]
MKYLFITILLLPFVSRSQNMAVVENFRDVAGTPFFPRQYVDVNGSPYMFEDFISATITLHDGRTIKGVKTNFNLVTEELLYMDEKGATMVASPKAIKRLETDSSEPRTFIPTQASNTFCEVISSEGKATLLKHIKKVIMETKPYNSSTIERSFVTDISHLVSVGGSISEVKSADDLYESLKSEQVKEFAKKEKLKKKSEESWVKIVDYFNSI